MLRHSSEKFNGKAACRRLFSASTALAIALAVSGLVQAQNQHTHTGHISVAVAHATQGPPKNHGHGPETNSGKTPRESSDGQTSKGSNDGRNSTGSNDGRNSTGSTGGQISGQAPLRTRPLPPGFEPFIPTPASLNDLPPQKLADKGPQISDKLD